MQFLRSQGASNSEVIWLFLLFAIFLAINLLTASLSPTVWMDEVTLADPAINLRLFGRLTSSAWYVQSDQEFWSGSPPLYSLLLSAWLWIAPISPTGVRSLNFILMVLSCLALWSALRRSQIIQSPAARLLFIVLVMCGACTAFSYRSGRPDTLGVLLVSILALLVVCKPSGLRLALVFVVGSLLPWTGLQVVLYAAILAAIAVIITRTLPLVSVVLAAGTAAGGIALGLLYVMAGTLSAFVASVRYHTVLTSGQGRDYASLLTVGREILVTDRSTLLLLPILAIVILMASRRTQDHRRLLWFFVLAIVLVPPILDSLGKFPFYYFWMVFIPLSFLAAFVIDHEWTRRKYVAIAAFGLVCGAMLVGLPARIAIALVEAQARDYSKASAYVVSVLKADDKAFIDYPAYYPAKLHTQNVYVPIYLQIISNAERRNVTVAILSGDLKDPHAFLTKEFGGDWEEAGPGYAPAIDRGVLGVLTLATPYRFVVFRRKPAAK